jgi:hypothetical protein
VASCRRFIGIADFEVVDKDYGTHSDQRWTVDLSITVCGLERPVFLASYLTSES